MNNKEWYKSKTLWANIFAITAGISLWAQGEIIAGAPITIAGISNCILRIVSDKRISF